MKKQCGTLMQLQCQDILIQKTKKKTDTNRIKKDQRNTNTG